MEESSEVELSPSSSCVNVDTPETARSNSNENASLFDDTVEADSNTAIVESLDDDGGGGGGGGS